MADSDILGRLLASAMRDARVGRGVALTSLARFADVSKAFLSEVEHGIKPASPRVVAAYDQFLELDGFLIGIAEDRRVALSQEASRRLRRHIANHDDAIANIPGDKSALVTESPDPIVLRPGETYDKTWTIRNEGAVPWVGRRLLRTGRLRGPEIPSSASHVDIPSTPPGTTITLAVTLGCANVAGTRLVRFKMIDSSTNRLCFPQDEFGVSAEVTSIVAQFV